MSRASYTSRRTGRPRRFGLSARVRIVGWCVLLVTLALAIAVLVAGRVLLTRGDNRLAAEIVHESNKLRAYASQAVDPRTAQPFATVDGLLAGYLRDNLPDHDETFFSVVDGAAAHRSAQRPLARVDRDADVVAFAAAATHPVAEVFPSSAGPALVGVFPVDMVADPRPAALVIVEFIGPERAEAWSLIRTLALISAIALAAAGLVAWLIAGRVLRPIRQVRQTADRIGDSDLSSRIDVTGNDDVAHLARTFNRMLDRLQAAFAAQRAFLNDAGHELRTPLTIVRGHLELMGTEPDEVRHTVPLLLDEVDRMRRIVDDLTVLAQADRPDFLHPEVVDAADLVVELIAKASAMAPRSWKIDAVTEAHPYADGQRLTQALMQLCANAVAHTGPEDTIAAGVAVVGADLRLWVRDTGSGIAPEDRDRIFERSVRGRSSKPGTGAGLGLAIVSSIAAAHGGTVTLESAPGVGSRFTIVIPLRTRAAMPDPEVVDDGDHSDR